MKALIICSIATTACVYAPAYAAQHCKPQKNEPRALVCIYEPDVIYTAWSAPGSVLRIKLAPDEQTLKVDAANSTVITEAHIDNLITLKFAGCAVPQPVFISSHKVTTDELRSYAFTMETRPQVCSRSIPETNDTSPQVSANGNVVPANYDDGHAPSSKLLSLTGTPDLAHLEHPDDLAEASPGGHGGGIPYLITMRYPADDRTKRETTERTAARGLAQRRVESLVANAAAGKTATTGFVNDHYYGRGEASMKPCIPECGPTDDGNTTFIFFPGDTPIPVFEKLTNQVCGDNGGEIIQNPGSSKQSRTINGRPTYGTLISLPGTAPGWCMRMDGKVYQLTNASYNPVGYPTGTNTPSPFVERHVRGSINDQ
jgi:type IV secretory pathway VirB9-like protein